MPPTPKRERDKVALTSEQAELFLRKMDEHFDTLDPDIAASVRPGMPTVEEMAGVCLPPHLRPVRTCRATDFESVEEVAEKFDLTTNRRAPFHFELKPEFTMGTSNLSKHTEATVNMLLDSPYNDRLEETSVRTLIHIVLLDRMQYLADTQAFSQMKLRTEVSISAHTTEPWKSAIVDGRANFVLAYGEQQQTHTVLTVVEGKKSGGGYVGLPQLLVYMIGVWERRYGRNNRSCFGLTCDGIHWTFAYLTSKKKLYATVPMLWMHFKSKIIAYLDMMLLDAIECSPTTTPTKVRNTTIFHYHRALQDKWDFGEEEEEQPSDSEIPMDIVKTDDGKIGMRTSRPHQ